MFPTLYHFIKDVLGWSFPSLVVVNTFGFFVALSILAAYSAMRRELKDRTGLKQLPTYRVLEVTGQPLGLSSYAFNALLGFVFGYKLVYLFISSAEPGFDPQEHLATSEGSLLWGFLSAAAVVGWLWWNDRKNRGAERVETEIEADASHHMGNISTIALLSGFAGAKVFHLLETPSNLSWDTFVYELFSSGGWTFYGGLICGALGVLWYTTKKGMKISRVLDSGAVAMMLAYGIGRFGCHFSGDGDWGLPNTQPAPAWLSWLPDWAWAYTYPNNVLGKGGAELMNMVPIQGCEGDYCYQLAVPVWPTPLYEALMGLALAAILWFFLRKRATAPGTLFAWYMVFAGVERFLIENIREHGESLYRFGGLVFSQAQMISILLMLGGTAWLVYSKWFKKHQVMAES